MRIITEYHGWWLDSHGCKHVEWSAIDDHTYSGPGSPIGTGSTEEEAIEDLLDQLHDREEAWREAQHDHWSCYPGYHKEG